ncbi:MAG: hypothetical protein AAGM38_18175 [Pseudomonadota bacterium]
MPQTHDRVGAGARADDAAAPRVRPARIEDAVRLAADLRPADRLELAALGRTPLEALVEGVAQSREAFVIHAAAEPEALMGIFGVAPHPVEPDVGAPWMLASPAIEAAARPFLRRCRPWVAHLGRDFLMLTNGVDARNSLHIAWLRWCGFSFLRRFEVGSERRPFLEFARLGGRAEAASAGAEAPQSGGDDMCEFATAIAASQLASTGAGLLQSQQNQRAAERAARREQERLRRQTINRYEALALDAAESRARRAERVRASRDEALRLAERTRTRRLETGGRGASLRASLRDIGGARARQEQQARYDDELRQQNLSVAATGQELQMQGGFDRAVANGRDYQNLLKGVAVGLEQTRTLKDLLGDKTG